MTLCQATLRRGGEGGGVGEGVEKVREHPVDLPRAGRRRLASQATQLKPIDLPRAGRGRLASQATQLKPIDLPRAGRGRLSARLVQTRRARMAREHAAGLRLRCAASPPRRPAGSAPPCVTWQGACTRLGRGASNRAAPAQPA